MSRAWGLVGVGFLAGPWAAHGSVAAPPPVTPTPTWDSPTLGTFHLIPSGTFMMGCVPGRDDVAGGCFPDESPAHPVTLTQPCDLMEHEVTQWEWQAVMGDNPSAFPWAGPDAPVESVSWDDAQAFAQAVSARDGVAYRLPTEAEWAYEPYDAAPVTDPRGSSSGRMHVNRGGGWGVPARAARIAGRSMCLPSDRYDILGFQLLRPIP